MLASLRAVQLMRGCQPRIASGHKATVTAQIEVSTGKIGAWEGPVVDPTDTPVPWNGEDA